MCCQLLRSIDHLCHLKLVVCKSRGASEWEALWKRQFGGEGVGVLGPLESRHHWKREEAWPKPSFGSGQSRCSGQLG